VTAMVLRVVDRFKIVAVVLVFTSSCFSQVTVDFGGRASATRALRPHIIASQLSFLNNGVGFSLLQQAGYLELRTNAYLENIFSGTGCVNANFQALDNMVNMLKPYKLKPLIMMGYTPSCLASVTSCTGTRAAHSAPTDINKWASLTAQVVKHLNATFPKWITDYEIWNEPNLSNGLCVADNSDTTRLNTYVQMFAAAASAMKTQAAADGMSINVGGPALTSGGPFSTWIPALLGNSTAAAKINFISYHQYLAGQVDITNGMTWDNSTTTRPLYSREQDPSKGLAGWFKTVSSYVSQAGKPNLPIWITEFNDDWAFQNTCCRNDPSYSPVFNAVAVAAYLNTAYSAKNPFGMLLYFSASTPTGFFCLVGTIDANMDCALNNTSVGGYPQYYTYKLVNAGGYLGLINGGHMAVSVTPSSALVVTGFYTAAQGTTSGRDSVLIVNPTSTDLNNIAVLLKNPGSTSYSGSSFLLNKTNPTILKKTANFTAVSAGASITVSVPHYSVLGLSLPAGP